MFLKSVVLLLKYPHVCCYPDQKGNAIQLKQLRVANTKRGKMLRSRRVSVLLDHKAARIAFTDIIFIQGL